MKRYKDPHLFELCGSRLALSLEYLNMNATDLAKSAGFSASQISNWITGQQRIGLDAMLFLSETYGVPLSFIYEGKLTELDMNFRKFVLSKSRDKWAR